MVIVHPISSGEMQGATASIANLFEFAFWDACHSMQTKQVASSYSLWRVEIMSTSLGLRVHHNYRTSASCSDFRSEWGFPDFVAARRFWGSEQSSWWGYHCSAESLTLMGFSLSFSERTQNGFSKRLGAWIQKLTWLGRKEMSQIKQFGDTEPDFLIQTRSSYLEF